MQQLAKQIVELEASNTGSEEGTHKTTDCHGLISLHNLCFALLIINHASNWFHKEIPFTASLVDMHIGIQAIKPGH